MFGKKCVKVGGKAAVALFKDNLVFKLPANEVQQALSLEGSELWDPSGKGRAMKEWVQIPKITENFKIIKAIDVFIGYLIFDCWIANQDRHHENWGIMLLNDDDICFAYTYDHAAGLGSKVSDEEAEKRLQTNDANYKISKFVTRAKTPFYNDSDKKMTTIAVVETLLKKYPIQTLYWIDKIENIPEIAIKNILDKVPDTFMSNISKEFASELLHENKKRLIKLKEGGSI